MTEQQTAVQTYGWDDSRLQQVFSLVLRDPTFFPRFRRAIRPEYFQDRDAREVVRILERLVSSYGKLPAEATLRAEVAQGALGEPARALRLNQLLDRAYALRVDDAAWLRDQVVSFGQRQSMVNALTQAIDLVDSGRYGDILKAVSDAHAVGHDVLDIGHRYFGDKDERLEQRSNRRRVGIPTGYPAVDHALDGGTRPGELYCVVAPPKAGKTIFLLNLVAFALRAGRRVLYYTLEVSEQIITERLDCRMLGYDKEFLRQNQFRVSTELDALRAQIGHGELIVKGYPTSSVTVDDVAAHADLVRDLEDFYPDIIFVDPADHLKWEHDKEYLALNAIFKGLRGMGGKLGTGVWTATWFTRGGSQKNVGQMTDVGGSFGKVAILDALFGLSYTEQEDAQNLRRLSPLAIRNGPGRRSVMMRCDFARCSMEPVHEGWAAGAVTAPPPGDLPPAAPVGYVRPDMEGGES